MARPGPVRRGRSDRLGRRLGVADRFLRDGTIIWKGTVSSLRRFKEDVHEVRAGFECGIAACTRDTSSGLATSIFGLTLM